MQDWHLAQANIARAVAPMDDPAMADFMAQLDTINALADRSPGFVWRLQSGSGNATDIAVTDDPLVILNMSVWESVDALFDYVYRTAHTPVMARRREWFEKPSKPHLVLWWVEAGHRPSVEEALTRLEMLAERGPTPDAFTFKQRFPAPELAAAGQSHAAD